MILPKGITGFLGKDTAPPQILDEKAFRQMCYSIAKENGGTVFDHTPVLFSSIVMVRFLLRRMCSMPYKTSRVHLIGKSTSKLSKKTENRVICQSSVPKYCATLSAQGSAKMKKISR